ncbi:hypothetical protein D3C83_19770 [compost metagenome]
MSSSARGSPSTQTRALLMPSQAGAVMSISTVTLPFVALTVSPGPPPATESRMKGPAVTMARPSRKAAMAEAGLAPGLVARYVRG